MVGGLNPETFPKYGFGTYVSANIYHIIFIEYSVADKKPTFLTNMSNNNTHFVKYPSTEHRLERIINYKYLSKLKRFSILHQSRSKIFGKISVKQTYE